MERAWHHGRVREVALAEALRRIAADGPGAVTLRGVARATGLSHTALGKEFGGLGAFLAACAVEIHDRLDAALREAEASSPIPLLAFRAMGLAYLRFAGGNPAWFAFLEHPLVAAAGDDALRAAAARPHATLVRILARCQAAGVVRAGPTEPLALLVWSAVHGFGPVTAWGLGGDREALAEQLVTGIYLGLMPLSDG